MPNLGIAPISKGFTVQTDCFAPAPAASGTDTSLVAAVLAFRRRVSRPALALLLFAAGLVLASAANAQSTPVAKLTGVGAGVFGLGGKQAAATSTTPTWPPTPSTAKAPARTASLKSKSHPSGKIPPSPSPSIRRATSSSSSPPTRPTADRSMASSTWNPLSSTAARPAAPPAGPVPGGRPATVEEGDARAAGPQGARHAAGRRLRKGFLPQPVRRNRGDPWGVAAMRPPFPGVAQP